MKNKNKGLFFGIIGMILVGVHPIIILGRPSVIDFYIFAAMNSVVAAIIFLPLILIERKRIKEDYHNNLLNFKEFDSLSNRWKKNLKFLIALGIIFGFGRIFQFYDYEITGAVLGH